MHSNNICALVVSRSLLSTGTHMGSTVLHAPHTQRVIASIILTHRLTTSQSGAAFMFYAPAWWLGHQALSSYKYSAPHGPRSIASTTRTPTNLLASYADKTTCISGITASASTDTKIAHSSTRQRSRRTELRQGVLDPAEPTCATRGDHRDHLEELQRRSPRLASSHRRPLSFKKRETARSFFVKKG